MRRPVGAGVDPREAEHVTRRREGRPEGGVRRRVRESMREPVSPFQSDEAAREALRLGVCEGTAWRLPASGASSACSSRRREAWAHRLTDASSRARVEVVVPQQDDREVVGLDDSVAERRRHAQSVGPLAEFGLCPSPETSPRRGQASAMPETMPYPPTGSCRSSAGPFRWSGESP